MQKIDTSQPVQIVEWEELRRRRWLIDRADLLRNSGVVRLAYQLLEAGPTGEQQPFFNQSETIGQHNNQWEQRVGQAVEQRRQVQN